MKNFNAFIEEARPLFENYRILDSNAVNALKINVGKGSFIAIAGEYFLNCNIKEDIYQHTFYLVVLLDKTKHFVLPIVWLPYEKIPWKFEHVYSDKTCCLGLTYEVLKIWGEEQTAQDFFEKIIDVFLINLLSFRNKGKCVTGERPHGEAGLIDYYKDLFDMTADEFRNALPYIYRKVIRKEFAKGHNLCPCGNKEIVRRCHGEKINSFLDNLYASNELKEGFIQDTKVYFERRLNNG